MPRQIRIHFPGALYHVMCRGNRREAILKTLGEAEKLRKAGLKTFGLEADELEALPKGHPEKAIIAREIRARTSAPRAWIADRLAMGTTPNIRRAVVSLEGELGKSAAMRKKNGAFLKRIGKNRS